MRWIGRSGVGTWLSWLSVVCLFVLTALTPTLGTGQEKTQLFIDEVRFKGAPKASESNGILVSHKFGGGTIQLHASSRASAVQRVRPDDGIVAGDQSFRSVIEMVLSGDDAPLTFYVVNGAAVLPDGKKATHILEGGSRDAAVTARNQATGQSQSRRMCLVPVGGAFQPRCVSPVGGASAPMCFPCGRGFSPDVFPLWEGLQPRM